jgi:hypothetical protein
VGNVCEEEEELYEEGNIATMLACIITRDFTVLDLSARRPTIKEQFTYPPFEIAGGDELWTTFSP